MKEKFLDKSPGNTTFFCDENDLLTFLNTDEFKGILSTVRKWRFSYMSMLQRK